MAQPSKSRRHFMRGTAFGIAALGLNGCVRPAQQARASLGQRALQARLARLDEALDALNETDLIGALVGERVGDDTFDTFLSAMASESRPSLRALMLTAVILDLPQEDQDQPEVQRLLDQHSGQLDETIASHVELLRSCPDPAREAAARELEEDPGLVMELGELPRHLGPPSWPGPRGATDFAGCVPEAPQRAARWRRARAYP